MTLSLEDVSPTHTTLKYESESNKTKDMSLSYLRVVCGIQFQLNARENFLKVTTKKSGKKRIEGA